MATWYEIRCKCGPNGTRVFETSFEQGQSVPCIGGDKLAENLVLGDKYCFFDGYGLEIDQITTREIV